MDFVDQLIRSKYPESYRSPSFDPVQSIIDQKIRQSLAGPDTSSFDFAPRNKVGLPLYSPDPSVSQATWEDTIGDVMDTGMGWVSAVAGVLNKPGRMVRGALGTGASLGGHLAESLGGENYADHINLGGSAREIMAGIPFSDTLGLTDPKDEVRGHDLMSPLNLSPENPEGFLEHIPGFLGEVALDPLTYTFGIGLLGKGGKAATALQKAGKIDEALSQARYLDDSGIVNISPGKGLPKGRTMGPREKLVATKPTDLAKEHQQIIRDDLARTMSPQEVDKAWDAMKNQPMGSMFGTEIPFVRTPPKWLGGEGGLLDMSFDPLINRLLPGGVSTRNIARKADVASEYLLRKNPAAIRVHQYLNNAAGGQYGYQLQNLARRIHPKTRDLDVDAQIDVTQVFGENYQGLAEGLRESIEPQLFKLTDDPEILKTMSISQKANLEDVLTSFQSLRESHPWLKNVYSDTGELIGDLDSFSRQPQFKPVMKALIKLENSLAVANQEILDTALSKILVTAMELSVKAPVSKSLDEAYDFILGDIGKRPAVQSFRQANDVKMQEMAESLLSYKDNLHDLAKIEGINTSDLVSMGLTHVPRQRDPDRYVREGLSEIVDRMGRRYKSVDVHRKDQISASRLAELRNLPREVVNVLFKDGTLKSLLRRLKFSRDQVLKHNDESHVEIIKSIEKEFKNRIMNSPKNGGLGFGQFFKTFDERLADISEGLGEDVAAKKLADEIEYFKTYENLSDEDALRKAQEKYDEVDRTIRDLMSYMADRGSLKGKKGEFYDTRLPNDILSYHISAMTKVKSLQASYEFIRDNARKVAVPGDISIYEAIKSIGSKSINIEQALRRFGSQYLGITDNFAEELSNIYVPGEVADALQNTLSFSLKQEAWWEDGLKIWDRLFKNPFEKGVTQPFPSYWNRNRYGGLWLNLISGHIKGPKEMSEYLGFTKQAKDWAINRSIPEKDKIELIQYGVFDPTRIGRELWEGVEGKPVAEGDWLPNPGIPGFVDTASEDFLGGLLSLNPKQAVSGFVDMIRTPFSPSRWGATGRSGKEAWKEAGEAFAEKDLGILQPGGGTAEFAAMPGVSTAQKFTGPVEARTRQVLGTAINFGQKQSDWVEYLNRVPMYYYLKSKGFSPRQAAAEVRKWQIDYSMVSRAHPGLSGKNFQATVMKRLIPFYSFQRMVGPLIIENLLQRPGGIQGQMIKATGRLAEDEENILPDYIAQTAAIPINRDADVTSYLTGFGLPHEDLFGLYRPGDTAAETARGTGMELLGKLNPVIKGPIELITGQSFFSGRNLSDYDGMMSDIASNIGAIEQRDKLKASNLYEHAFANSPLSRLGSSIRKVTDPRRRRSIEDSAATALNLLTGVRVTDADIKRNTQLKMRDTLNLLMSEQQGVRFMKRPYMPDQDMATEKTRAMLTLYNELMKK